jgi:hypothetical protein
MNNFDIQFELLGVSFSADVKEDLSKPKNQYEIQIKDVSLIETFGECHHISLDNRGNLEFEATYQSPKWNFLQSIAISIRKVLNDRGIAQGGFHS